MSRQKLRAAIGERLRKARIQAKLNQEDVAEEFSRTRQAISSWESGRTMPSLEEFAKLSMRYGVSADQILHGLQDVKQAADQVLGRARAAAGASLLGADKAEFSA